MCAVLRHKVIGNLLQQQKGHQYIQEENSMSYAASRTFGTFPWMFTESICFFYTWNHSCISGGRHTSMAQIGNSVKGKEGLYLWNTEEIEVTKFESN